MFITLEGGEGTGKTTQAKLLEQDLLRQGRQVLLTREPGGTDLGERVRDLLLDAKGQMDPWAELLLFAAARAEHRSKAIAPALDRGAIVLCDRYSDATVAYQGYGRGLPIPAIKEICRWAEQGVKPHVTILIDLDPEVGLRRVKSREKKAGEAAGAELTRFDAAPLPFHARVRRGYLSLAREEPSRFEVVDGVGTPGDVAATIAKLIRRRLPAR